MKTKPISKQSIARIIIWLMLLFSFQARHRLGHKHSEELRREGKAHKSHHSRRHLTSSTSSEHKKSLNRHHESHNNRGQGHKGKLAERKLVIVPVSNDPFFKYNRSPWNSPNTRLPSETVRGVNFSNPIQKEPVRRVNFSNPGPHPLVRGASFNALVAKETIKAASFNSPATDNFVKQVEFTNPLPKNHWDHNPIIVDKHSIRKTDVPSSPRRISKSDDDEESNWFRCKKSQVRNEYVHYYSLEPTIVLRKTELFVRSSFQSDELSNCDNYALDQPEVDQWVRDDEDEVIGDDDYLSFEDDEN